MPLAVVWVTFAALHYVRLWHIADITTPLIYVRFWGKADIDWTRSDVRF